jgi:HSP20 family protein
MASILRHEDWDLRRDLTRLQQEMNQLSRRAIRPSRRRRARIFPSIIISATDEKLVVRAELPGIVLEDLDISVSGDTLTVQGQRFTGEASDGGWYHRRERERGDFSRAVQLPAQVDGDRAEASYVAGVLTISLPLKQPAKPKQITVSVAEG